METTYFLAYWTNTSNWIYDGVETETKKSQATFRIILVSCEAVPSMKPEDHWSCIAHLSAEYMLKSAVIEEKKFKLSRWAGADNPLGPKF